MKNSNNLTLILVIGIFLVIGCICPRDRSERSTTSTPSGTQNPPAHQTPRKGDDTAAKETPRKEVGAVNMENFNKLKTGMKYSEVVEILGKEGEILSETEVGGYKTVMYKWDGESLLSNMNAMFQNGKMISKAQFGLK